MSTALARPSSNLGRAGASRAGSSGNQAKVIELGLEQFVERLARAIGKTLLRNLAYVTPKDTGFAASNWVAQIGSPFSGIAGSRLQAELGQLDRITQSGSWQALDGYKLSQGPIFITNNVSYITDLNRGSSRQAPPNFVQLEMLTSIAQVGQNPSLLVSDLL